MCPLLQKSHPHPCPCTSPLKSILSILRATHPVPCHTRLQPPPPRLGPEEQGSAQPAGSGGPRCPRPSQPSTGPGSQSHPGWRGADDSPAQGGGQAVLPDPSAGGRQRGGPEHRRSSGYKVLEPPRSVPGSGRRARRPDPRTRVLQYVGGGAFSGRRLFLVAELNFGVFVAADPRRTRPGEPDPQGARVAFSAQRARQEAGAAAHPEG